MIWDDQMETQSGQPNRYIWNPWEPGLMILDLTSQMRSCDLHMRNNLKRMRIVG